MAVYFLLSVLSRSPHLIVHNLLRFVLTRVPLKIAFLSCRLLLRLLLLLLAPMGLRPVRVVWSVTAGRGSINHSGGHTSGVDLSGVDLLGKGPATKRNIFFCVNVVSTDWLLGDFALNTKTL